MADFVQPLRVKHVMRSASERNHSCQAVCVSVCSSNGIVAAGGKAPHAQLLAIYTVLRVQPVKEGRPQSLGTFWVLWRGWAISSARNLHYAQCYAIPPPPFRPAAQFCTITVQSSYNYHTWRWLLLCSGVRNLMEDRKITAVTVGSIYMGYTDLMDRSETLNFAF